MTVIAQLHQIDQDYNLYKISKEEAIKRATPLIETFNKASNEKAAKYHVRPMRLNLKRFAFGK